MKIVQIIPVRGMFAEYAIDTDDDGKALDPPVIDRVPIVGLVLCEDGCVYPLVFDCEQGVNIEMGETCNFMRFGHFKLEK